MKRISIIIPCYNSSQSIGMVSESIMQVLGNDYDVEIILSNDGSKDETWSVILDLCKKYNNIIGLNLSRNFGQQSARMAALQYVTGECAIFMDDDGQHDPKYIPELIQTLEKGYDIVYADFVSDNTALWRRLGSGFRYISAKVLEGTPVGIRPTAFFITRRFLIEGLKGYTSPTPSIFGYLIKSTRNIGTVPVPKQDRISGHSGYNLRKLVSLWLNEMVGFSIIPLRISSVVGVLAAISAVIMSIFMIINKLIDSSVPLGYTSTIVVILFFSGIILMVLGIIGEYIGRLCMSVNNTPQYMVRDIIKREE